MAIHAKFSIPVACLVFARDRPGARHDASPADGKLGGFVVGIGVIFAYYIAMFLAESAAKGHRIPAEYARWVPNMLLGPFGVVALFWRAGHAEGRLPFGIRLPQMPACPACVREAGLTRTRPQDAADARRQPSIQAATGARAGRRASRGFTSPVPSLLDRYISRLYLRVAGLSFLALLGLFYISTFIDRSDKIFKGQASAAMIGHLLV